jgi:serine/threonine protein kinase
MFQVDQILHDRYQLQTRLGRTAAGRQTWLAHDRDDANQPVVVKLLVFNPEFQWDNLKLFEREAQVLANLDHPQIPQYIDFFVADSADQTTLHWWALVQEFVPGDSLQDLLDRRYKFAPDAIRDIALDALEILTYLHELSPPVLHRDIKPSNLMLGEDNKVYLIDFGSVQDETKVTGMTFTVVGTIGYAPMEQFWGRSVPASDLYGLGATLIHLITGVPPADLPQADLRLQFADRMGHTRIAASWLSEMVEPAIEHRYQSARSAYQDLLNGEAKAGQLARPESSSMQIAINGGDLEIWPSRRTRSTIATLSKRRSRRLILSYATLSISLLVSLLVVVVPALELLQSAVSVIPALRVLLFAHTSEQALLTMLGLALGTCLISPILLIRQNTKPVALRFSGRIFEILRHKTRAQLSSRRTKALVISHIDQIQSVVAQDMMLNAIEPRRSLDYWQVVIQTSQETYRLPWKLSQEECHWLVQEIQNWLDRYYQGIDE